MPNCTRCGESMWIVRGENSTAAAYACVNATCSPDKSPATLDDVLAELRAIRALMELWSLEGFPSTRVAGPRRAAE